MRNGETESESMRRKAHQDYASAFWEMRADWSPAELNAAIAGGYDKPQPYENGQRGAQYGNDDDNEFHDPADRAVDNRIPIVDFESVSAPAIQKYCDDFRVALEWATRTKNGKQIELMQMGARMLTLFDVLRPQLKIGMDLPIPRSMRDSVRRAICNDPHEIGKFFRRPFAWVRKCTSLVQLGTRAFAMIYVMAGDLINSQTCAEIAALDDKTRQAFNKLVQDFRDTYTIKSLPMRGKTTRKRCKHSQEELKRKPQNSLNLWLMRSNTLPKKSRLQLKLRTGKLFRCIVPVAQVIG